MFRTRLIICSGYCARVLRDGRAAVTRRRRGPVGVVVAAALALSVGVLSVAGADDVDPTISDSADPGAAAAAVRLSTVPAGDIVSVSRIGDVDDALWVRVRDAAAAAGARAALGRSAQVQLTALRRGGVVVDAPPAGWALPHSLTVLELDVIDATMGSLVSSGLARRATVAMARSTAEMRGAVEGDTIDLRNASGSTTSFVITRIAPDDMVGGTELVMTPVNAATLGISPAGRVIVHDIPSRDALDAAFTARGLVDSEQQNVLVPSSVRLRVRRSWAPRDPDSTLGLLQTKKSLGEFAYVVRSAGDVTISQSWIDEHVACNATRPIFYCRALLDPVVTIRARCHDDVVGALRGALGEVTQRGLAGAIDVANANAYGGCFYPRFNRLATNPFSGSLSRHSWAMALDTNTTTNAQGAVPRMDCRVVRIFRKWGFSWGGNYLTPDGMHFEWVGEPRHRLAYPSKYCANDGTLRAVTAPEETQRPMFFSHDGWMHQELDH
jgi:hypothetical protein